MFRQSKNSYLWFTEEDVKHSKPIVFVKFKQSCDS